MTTRIVEPLNEFICECEGDSMEEVGTILNAAEAADQIGAAFVWSLTCRR